MILSKLLPLSVYHELSFSLFVPMAVLKIQRYRRDGEDDRKKERENWKRNRTSNSVAASTKNYPWPSSISRDDRSFPLSSRRILCLSLSTRSFIRLQHFQSPSLRNWQRNVLYRSSPSGNSVRSTNPSGRVALRLGLFRVGVHAYTLVRDVRKATRSYGFLFNLSKFKRTPSIT